MREDMKRQVATIAIECERNFFDAPTDPDGTIVPPKAENES